MGSLAPRARPWAGRECWEPQPLILERSSPGSPEPGPLEITSFRHLKSRGKLRSSEAGPSLESPSRL